MKKILFICTANKIRSLTAEKMYKNDSRFIVKSAGTDISANICINRNILEWSDYIFVMEKKHRNIIRAKFPDLYKTKRIICLYIPDEYDYMEEELMILINNKIENFFGINIGKK